MNLLFSFHFEENFGFDITILPYIVDNLSTNRLLIESLSFASSSFCCEFFILVLNLDSAFPPSLPQANTIMQCFSSTPSLLT